MPHSAPQSILLRAALILCTAAATLPLQAQENRINLPRLKTLRVEANGQWDAAPVILLNAGQFVNISFDDLQHNYVRYTYNITHCNADWTPSALLENEYMDGFNGLRIDRYEPSLATAVDYNHYTLTLPNDDVRQLKVSGNYRVDIFEDGNDAPVATACFSIVEPKVGIGINVTPNTDIDAYRAHQQLELEVNYAQYSVSNPETELRPVVVQNRRWDKQVSGLRPTYLQANKLLYSHNRALIFEAGNEYRRFEILDEYVPTMRVESMQWVDPLYHAYVMTDEQRINYIYDEDQNGRYLVRNGDNEANETESDYFITHFRLEMPEIPGGDLYLNGDLTNNMLTEEFRMQYNLIDHAYELAIPLKQGSYNYQYLFLPSGSASGSTTETEGNFHQTENEYGVYVYHRPFGDRYDHLVGYNRVNYRGQ